MRPFLVLSVVALLAVAAFGQTMPHPYPYSYNYGYTYAPLLTTPMMSLQTYSPNPVGASNATTGLVAGATNATVSDLPEGSTSSDYTVAVWYQGGSPLITPEVNTWPIPHEGMMAGPMMGYGMGEEHERHHEKRAQWTYFSGPEHTTPVAEAATGPGPAKHSYSNDDVTRQNDKNGEVRYDGKTEKIQ
jgi:hypothetical protein